MIIIHDIRKNKKVLQYGFVSSLLTIENIYMQIKSNKLESDDY